MLNIKYHFDAPIKNQLFFQDVATPAMERIINLHNEIMIFLIFTFIFVSWILMRSIYLFRETNTETLRFSFQHNTLVEQIWTVIPALILLLIALPSCSLLYLTDEITSPLITIKVTGYQWYWTYNYADHQNIQYDSYMIQEDLLSKGQIRLLEVDNALYLPTNVPIRVLVTSADVIHSWALPSAGVKMDAVPGRNNQVSVYFIRKGIFYGQCSELCGVNHGFMPIKVVTLPMERWIEKTYMLYKQR